MHYTSNLQSQNLGVHWERLYERCLVCLQGLTEAKMELRRKEHAVRQVSKQMSYMENEKNALVDRLNDAEKTMTAAAR